MKIKELQEVLKERELDALVLFRGDPNINYFSGNPYIKASPLIVPQNKEAYFISKKSKFEDLENKAKIRCKEISGDFKEFIENKFKKKKIGVNKSGNNALLFAKLNELSIKFEDVSEELRKIRSIKTEEEIEKIKKSCRILSETFREVVEDFEFKTEREVEVALTKISKEKGGDFCFKAMVASGNNSGLPHYFANNSKLKEGFCIIDFGVKYRGYCSDMTRTVFLGNPKEEHKKMYNKVLKAHNLAARECKKGIKASSVAKKVRKYLGDLEENFTHKLGHGIGMEIHELPNLYTDSEDVLKKNNCFTIEPGLYFPNKFGIRIEDSYLLRNKLIPLTKVNKELKVI